MGKRVHGAGVPRRHRAARRRGLQLPARGRRRHEHGRGLRVRLVGARLRRLRAAGPTSPRCVAIPWLPGTALCMCDLQWHDGSPVVPSPRQILRAQLARLAERGWRAMVGSELEFLLFAESYDECRAKGYRDLRLANAYNVDYSILGSTYVEPVLRAIRLGMAGCGHAGRGLQGRVQLRAARGELPLRRGARDGRRPHDLPQRRQGDRVPARATRSRSCRSSTSARATRATSTSRCGTASAASSRTRRGTGAPPLFSSFLAGLLAHLRELTLLPGAERQQLQALPARLLRADGARLGGRQPHLRAPRRRARQRHARRVPRRRRRREPVPGVLGADRGRSRGHRRRLRARAGLGGLGLRRARPPARARDAARVDRAARRARRWRARRSATRSSTTTCTRRASSRSSSTGP